MRRKSTGAEVLAATAGDDTWKTWAGRSQGSAEFELFDILRGAKRKFNQKFIWGVPPAGTSCPVCMTIPHSKSDWHVVSACGHASCKDCLQGYASSLVHDPSHHGPLKCPVCPLPLRPKDAIQALGGDPELLRLWDKKIRDEVLRALPGFRHCPHCSRQDQDDGMPTSTLVGGGFVTPECLAPINKRRERTVQKWLGHWFMTSQGVLFLYGIYFLLYFVRFHSSDVYVNLINVTIVPLWLLNRVRRVFRHIVAFQARKALFAPITAECPCCDKKFILNAESELGNNVIVDEATKAWIGSNTRPCPSCAVPIAKIDGCNHMHCTHCRASFCWACMRVGTACASFKCHNGAPYGSVGTEDSQASTARDQGGVLSTIERISNESTRVDICDGIIFVGAILSLAARENPSVQWLATLLVTSFAVLFSSGTIFSLLLLAVLFAMARDRNNTRFRDVLLDETATRGLIDDLFGVDRRTRIAEAIRDRAVERTLIAEAIRRSIVEQ
jgi:hypothetical protein